MSKGNIISGMGAERFAYSTSCSYTEEIRGAYKYVYLRSSGTFTNLSALIADICIVGGGGLDITQ